MSAPAAVGVVVIIAVLAQRDIPAAGIFVCPQALPALMAEDGMGLQTIRAQILSVKLGVLIPWPLVAADVADKGML